MKNTRQEGRREDLLTLAVYDTMQQHLFALTMQVGALKLLLKQDPDTVLETVQKIEHLTHLVQFNLNSMRLNLNRDYN